MKDEQGSADLSNALFDKPCNTAVQILAWLRVSNIL